ncbi:MAG: aminotransferase class I/II-fold pyridoxal phosphate-dependent enzyme [Treponema sp.]|jgi:histidinol-phosphate aminotransferase|nr:aminotransferase class I/II-fold pyridoxal phosphate-dependent enzyme [Treponema sp.]
MYMIHGGDIYSARLSGGKTPLDFSSNLNPLGLPKASVRAIKKEAAGFAVYPDPLCRRLRSALGVEHKTDPERIVCGAGAADIIYRIVRCYRPGRTLLLSPAFSEYEKAAAEAGGETGYFRLEYPRFNVDTSLLPLITNKTELFFLCNPNNPTGNLAPFEMVEAIIEKCNATQTLLVIDECFNGFLDDPAGNSADRFLDTVSKLVILKAFTKIYAMAGLRLGYALCSTPEIAGGIANTGQSWPVSLPAERAGLAALEDQAYLKRSRDLVRRERGRLKPLLSNLGLEVLGGEANYIFFRLPEDSLFRKETFFQDMLDRGILLRSCGNYPSLDDSYYRAAVKKPSDNDTLIAALEDLLS